jgi:dipeptidyl-peptidase-4
MRKAILIITAALLSLSAFAQEFVKAPVRWKWVSEKEVMFTYDGSYTDDAAFKVNAKNLKRETGVKAPEKFSTFPIKVEGAINMTYSPDSTKLAYTKNNDIYVTDLASGKETRLTTDGTDLILNGYASWVYYEEIFGRPSMYRAFWWSPDSKKIAYYRFDNTQVPFFPIYSPFGQDGKLINTRYPKAGETNPEVKIGIVDLGTLNTTWADFNHKDDQYFGTPFWSDDSQRLYVSRMPRIQNTLDLYAVQAADGSKSKVYHEEYKTWLDWIDGMIFTKDGFYMARRFETGWDQIYFLSYDGKLTRLTDGPNWSVALVRVDEKSGDVYFTAKRDATVRQALYKVDKKGVITAMTDPAFMVQNVSFSPDGRYFVASYSNMTTPNKVALFDVKKPQVANVIADTQGPDFDRSKYALPELITMTTSDGFVLPAMIVYPKNFDKTKKYPVHMDIYGGPDSPQVRDRWVHPSAFQWYSDNEIIQITCDCRAGGHNGRAGLDYIYKNLTVNEVRDFIEWAKYLQSLPYVQSDKIGVEGFSFGGTMTTMLLCQAPEQFHYGVAGGGVYDWILYDTHYTERFMETPQTNPEGYKAGSALEYVKGYPTVYGSGKEVEPVMLKITHGTGDDNVHFQNTLQLIDIFQKEGKKFEFMIYPDGMHGYRGYQQKHFQNDNRAFWLKYLKNQY